MNSICKRILLLLAVALAGNFAVEACTSVIVSGRVTPDGRPFIFKNRDTGDLDNLAMLVSGHGYTYIAIVAARDTLPQSVWSGHNERGFAIANTAAYNLNGRPQPGKPQPDGDELDGTIMRRALETCATLADFEHLLDSIKARGPIPSNSNFAVLDAQGGCAYYETGNKGYVKFDANDPAQAPYGYIVRTNHAMSGDRSMDKGVERYMAITDFMNHAEFCGQVNFEYILRRVPRYLKHGLTGIDLYDIEPEDDSHPKLFPFRDFIPRYQTASAQLIQGVRSGESGLHTVAWTITGSPLTTVAVPLVITPSGKLPAIVTRGSDGHAPLVHAGLKLKERFFPLKRGNTGDYIDVAQLINKRGTGILQQIEPVETETIGRGKAVIGQLYGDGKASANGKDKVYKAIEDYYDWVDTYVAGQYWQRFGLKL